MRVGFHRVLGRKEGRRPARVADVRRPSTVNRSHRIEAFRTAATVHGLQLIEVFGDRATAVAFLQRWTHLEQHEVSDALDAGGWTHHASLLDVPGPLPPILAWGNGPGLESERAAFEAHGILCRVVKLKASAWEEARDQALDALIFGQGWRSLGGSQRLAWLDTVRARRFLCGQEGLSDRPDVTVRIDGASVVDVAGLFLAVGEGVNGPGGYFGCCLDSFGDCLDGGFGIVPPFSLVWDDSQCSAMHIADFEYVVRAIRRMGVRVALR